MKSLSILVGVIATAMVMTMSVPTALAETKPVGTVIGNCDAVADKDPSKCGYTAGDNGDLSGCFKGGDCFYCPADGSRQCTILLTGKPSTIRGGIGAGIRAGASIR